MKAPEQDDDEIASALGSRVPGGRVSWQGDLKCSVTGAVVMWQSSIIYGVLVLLSC